MDVGNILLIVLFFATIAHLLSLKVCSVTLDHRTAPLFISGWTLLGLLGAAPFFGHLWTEGQEIFIAHPMLLILAMAKGMLLYLLFVISQQLMQVSLSSRHYVTPLTIGFMAVINSFLGENLTPQQWAGCLGLFALAVGFFFKGHLSELSRPSRLAYGKLVALGVTLGVMDHFLTGKTNWFSLLLVSNITLFVFSLALNYRNVPLLKAAFMHKSAAIAGMFYMAAELIKFYQQVSINPVSVVVTVQALTKPVILMLSALIWHERTVREQLIWGGLAFVATLPLFF